MKGLMLVLIAVALLAFAAGNVVTPQPVNSSRSGSSLVVASRDADEEGIDAYGNEINNAVAEYSLDTAGVLYERHAPQVEVPRLGSPKS